MLTKNLKKTFNTQFFSHHNIQKYSQAKQFDPHSSELEVV